MKTVKSNLPSSSSLLVSHDSSPSLSLSLRQVGGLTPVVSPTWTGSTTRSATTSGSSTGSSGTTSEAPATPCAPPPWWYDPTTSNNTPTPLWWCDPMAVNATPKSRPDDVKHPLSSVMVWPPHSTAPMVQSCSFKQIPPPRYDFRGCCFVLFHVSSLKLFHILCGNSQVVAR